MLRDELVGAAVTLSVIWLVWGRRVNAQLAAMRNEVEDLRAEKDVDEAMKKLSPQLRVVRHNQ